MAFPLMPFSIYLTLSLSKGAPAVLQQNGEAMSAFLYILSCADGSYYVGTTDAIAAERQVKGWRRAKKEALIRGDYEALRKLAATATPRCSIALRPSTSSG